jgi:hypothetical protein
MKHGRVQLQNPVRPLSCGLSDFAGLLGSFTGGAAKSAKPSDHAAHTKRQDWLSSVMPAISVFVGGGGSVGSGNAFAVKDSKVKSGAYIGQSDKFQFASEIVNYDPVEKEIYLTLDFEWVPGKTPGLLNVGMGSFTLNCTTWDFQPPKDRSITLTGTNWTTTDNGYFVNFSPHIHDGGINIKVFLNGKLKSLRNASKDTSSTQGFKGKYQQSKMTTFTILPKLTDTCDIDEEVCESRAIYGTGDGATTIGNRKWETITGYTPCQIMKQFKKGDILRMTSEYDLTKHTL